MGEISGLPRVTARLRASDMLRHVGLFEERYRPIGTYSTGMKQRVKLAQALVHDPAIAFLDEPTAGLDPSGRREMLELVARVGREFGISIVVSTHLMGDVERVCDNVVVLGRRPRAAHRRGGGLHARRRTRCWSRWSRARRRSPRARAARARPRASTAAVLTLEEPRGDDLDALRDAVVESGALLYRLAPARLALLRVFAPPPRGRGEEVAP